MDNQSDVRTRELADDGIHVFGSKGPGARNRDEVTIKSNVRWRPGLEVQVARAERDYLTHCVEQVIDGISR